MKQQIRNPYVRFARGASGVYANYLGGSSYAKTFGNPMAGLSDSIKSLGASQGVQLPSAGNCRLTDDLNVVLDIPTVVPGNDEVAHPSVLFIPEGFNGKRWWMAITPLPVALGGDFEAWENPSIYCSDDGIEWAAPDGLTNPISPDPGGVGDHNADTCLVLSPDRATLHCIWTEQVSGTEKVQLKSSSNGVSWGSITTLLSVSTAAERVLSPQLNWDGDQWIMHTSDVLPSPNVMRYCTRTDLKGEFGARTACDYVLPDSETDVWHMDIRRLETGRWIGVLGTDASGGPHPQYPMQSDDGISWIFGEILSIRHGYKCAIVPISDYVAWFYWGFRGDPDWHVELSKLVFDGSNWRTIDSLYKATAASGAASKYGNFYMEDSFARANESPIANSDSGDAWIAVAGQFNVVSNKMAANAVGNNIATIDGGFKDADIQVDFSSITGRVYVVLRLGTSSQFHRIGLSADDVYFQRVGGSGTAELRRVDFDTGTTRRVRVICRDYRYSLFLDDTFMFSIEDEDHATETQFGVQVTDITSRIERVIISRL